MTTRLSWPVSLCLVLAFATGAYAGPMVVTDVGVTPGDMAIGPATNSQQDHSVARGGEFTLVAWSDSRGRSSGSQTIQSDGDIFGIRLDSRGVAVDPIPFLIAGGMGLQDRPLVAWNGQNWLVLFRSQDPVGGYFETQMRAVRVSPDGQVLDTIPILFPPTQFSPSTIGMQLAGQNGQWLITRCVYHNDGYGTFLAGQRISGAGQLLDSTPIMLLDWVYGQTALLAANGEYLAAGPDWNNSSMIKAQRVNLNALPVGPSFTLPSLKLATNGTEYYVAWIADFVNLVGSRVTGTGTLLTPAGTTIVANFSQFNEYTLAHDGAQWWLEWGAADQLHTVRIDANGVVLDPNGGPTLPIVIGGNINYAYNPRMAPRDGGGVLIFWYDSRVSLGYDSNVFVLPITTANMAEAERCVSTGTTNQRNSDLAGGPNGLVALAMVSEQANADRVLVHFLNSAGQTLSPEPVEVAQAPTIGRVGIAWNGVSFLIAWDQGGAGLTPTQVFARRMNPDGTFLDAAPFVVMPGFNAAVEALGEDFLVAAARFDTYPQFIYLWANRIDGPSGAVLDGANGLFLGGGYVNGAPRVRSDGLQWWVAAHSMWTHDASQGDAILAKVPAVGAPTQAFNPTPISGGSGDLDIAFSGAKYLLVWRMNSLSNANNYIAGRFMNADGTFPGGYFTIAEATGRQLRPTVDWDGAAFVVAWDDQRNQDAFFDARTNVYATRITEAGQIIDVNAFPVVIGTTGGASPALLSRGSGATLVSTTRFVTTPPYDTYRIGMTLLNEFLPGDINGDGTVNSGDVPALIAVLLGVDGDPNHVAASDLNGDGLADGRDIAPLVRLLTTGP